MWAVTGIPATPQAKPEAWSDTTLRQPECLNCVGTLDRFRAKNEGGCEDSWCASVSFSHARRPIEALSSSWDHTSDISPDSPFHFGRTPLPPPQGANVVPRRAGCHPQTDSARGINHPLPRDFFTQRTREVSERGSDCTSGPGCAKKGGDLSIRHNSSPWNFCDQTIDVGKKTRGMVCHEKK